MVVGPLIPMVVLPATVAMGGLPAAAVTALRAARLATIAVPFVLRVLPGTSGKEQQHELPLVESLKVGHAAGDDQAAVLAARRPLLIANRRQPPKLDDHLLLSLKVRGVSGSRMAGVAFLV